MSAVVPLRPWWFWDTGRQASFIQSSNLSCGLPSTFLFQCIVSLRQSEIVTTWSANLSCLYFPTKQTNVEALCNISLVPYSRLQRYISLYEFILKHYIYMYLLCIMFSINALAYSLGLLFAAIVFFSYISYLYSFISLGIIFVIVYYDDVFEFD